VSVPHYSSNNHGTAPKSPPRPTAAALSHAQVDLIVPEEQEEGRAEEMPRETTLPECGGAKEWPLPGAPTERAGGVESDPTPADAGAEPGSRGVGETAASYPAPTASTTVGSGGIDGAAREVLTKPVGQNVTSASFAISATDSASTPAAAAAGTMGGSAST